MSQRQSTWMVLQRPERRDWGSLEDKPALSDLRGLMNLIQKVSNFFGFTDTRTDLILVLIVIRLEHCLIHLNICSILTLGHVLGSFEDSTITFYIIFHMEI